MNVSLLSEAVIDIQTNKNSVKLNNRISFYHNVNILTFSAGKETLLS